MATWTEERFIRNPKKFRSYYHDKLLPEFVGYLHGRHHFQPKAEWVQLQEWDITDDTVRRWAYVRRAIIKHMARCHREGQETDTTLLNLIAEYQPAETLELEDFDLIAARRDLKAAVGMWVCLTPDDDLEKVPMLDV